MAKEKTPEEQKELQALIEQMRSQDNDKARAAVDTLREKGWLTDGSLIGTDLSEANLEDADLKNADLRNARLNFTYLTKANLSFADLSFADLRDSNLNSADLRDSKLEGANLDSIDLNNAYLGGTDIISPRLGTKLRGVNLNKADLKGADLRGVDLRDAILKDASLFGTNLFMARLDWADLSGTDLSCANLNSTDLNRANFTNALCRNTVFSDVDLSLVKGLENIKHRGASHIDIYTLYKSKGKIPEVFLRGCGVPEEFLQFTKGLFGKVVEFYSCFISYSRKDQSFARRVHDTLQMRGIRCWLDEKQLNIGDDIRDAVGRGIRIWDKVLLCCSEHSLTSTWVEEELDHALEKEARLKKEHDDQTLVILPLDLDGHLFDGYTGGRGATLRKRLAANFKGWEKDNTLFEEQIERVIKALRTDGGHDPEPEPKL